MAVNGDGKKRRGNLSRDKILETGLALLKRDGQSGVSMRKVADSLDVAPMSLYSHVKNKEDLLEGILSKVLSSLHVDILDEGTWLDRVGAWMIAVREQLNAYPEVLPLFSQNGRFSEAYIGAVDVLVAALREAGFNESEVFRQVRLINWSVFGFVLVEAVVPSEDQLVGQGFINRMAFENVDELFEHHVQIFLDGLSAELTRVKLLRD